jgi:hypothetical protein
MSTRLALIFGGFALAGLVQLALARWLVRKTRVLGTRGKRASELWVGPAIFYLNGGLMVLAAAVCVTLTLAGVLPDDP